MLITESQLKSVIRKILKEGGGGDISTKINTNGISQDTQRVMHMGNPKMFDEPDRYKNEKGDIFDFSEETQVSYFYENILAVLKVCIDQYPKVWDEKIVMQEARSILENFKPAGSIDGFDNWWHKVKNGQIKYKKNYPLEIIFNNIVGTDAVNRGDATIKSLLMQNINDESNHKNIARRLYKTLLLRKKNKK